MEHSAEARALRFFCNEKKTFASSIDGMVGRITDGFLQSHKDTHTGVMLTELTSPYAMVFECVPISIF